MAMKRQVKSFIAERRKKVAIARGYGIKNSPIRLAEAKHLRNQRKVIGSRSAFGLAGRMLSKGKRKNNGTHPIY